MIKDGGILPVIYPWIERYHLTRSSALIKMGEWRTADGVEDQVCYLDHSTFIGVDEMTPHFSLFNHNREPNVE